MDLQRYVIAGGASLVIHAVLLFVSQETKVFAMPAGNKASSVTLNLVAAPKLLSAEPAAKEIVQQSEPEIKKQFESKPVPEPVKKAVEKPIVKKDALKKKPTESKPEPIKKTNATQQPEAVVNKEPKPTKEKEKLTKKEDSQPKSSPTEQSKGVSSQPVLLEKPTFVSQPIQPRYPRSARTRGIEGVAVYEIWLDENGNQLKQVLIESSGADMLDNSALSAIKQWQFSPHISGGLKVAHRVQIPVRFKLDG
ncbi:TonB family protein [Vibrio sp. YIC-376]|uniref:TonB family protein n=1 Tax=Vibrio sp. YIC-376 TaxID=3136162 RepID=UPI00402ABEE3